MTGGRRQSALVVGGRGAIGSAVTGRLARDDFDVLITSRRGSDEAIGLDSGQPERERRATLSALPELDALVFAHGSNLNDAVGGLDLAQSRSILDANLHFVVESLDALASSARLRPGARVVVITSVWEVIARPGKFSYTVSKAALGGLVRAAASDLAAHDVLINAVLPGVVDTPMTRSMLSTDQIAAVQQSTGFGRLVDLDAVAAVVGFLCSPANTAITGQSIAVDLGFSIVRNV